MMIRPAADATIINKADARLKKWYTDNIFNVSPHQLYWFFLNICSFWFWNQQQRKQQDWRSCGGDQVNRLCVTCWFPPKIQPLTCFNLSIFVIIFSVEVVFQSCNWFQWLESLLACVKEVKIHRKRLVMTNTPVCSVRPKTPSPTCSPALHSFNQPSSV